MMISPVIEPGLKPENFQEKELFEPPKINYLIYALVHVPVRPTIFAGL